MVARNLLIPFRRDRKRDIATGDGEALLASKVRQVLLTEGSMQRSSGELLWRTSFGAGLAFLRHRPNDGTLAELARVCVRDALVRWVPGTEVLEVQTHPSSSALELRLRIRAGTIESTVVVPL